MSKKRKCRYTADENAIHDEAVRLRKMTDEQLVAYIERTAAEAREEGFLEGSAAAPDPKEISCIVDEIGTIRGIGAAKMQRVSEILNRRLVRA